MPQLKPDAAKIKGKLFSIQNPTFPIRWPKYWSFSFSISPSSEYSGLVSFRMDWFDLLVVQSTLKSFLQHHSLTASILWSCLQGEKILPRLHNNRPDLCEFGGWFCFTFVVQKLVWTIKVSLKYTFLQEPDRSEYKYLWKRCCQPSPQRVPWDKDHW